MRSVFNKHVLGKKFLRKLEGNSFVSMMTEHCCSVVFKGKERVKKIKEEGKKFPKRSAYLLKLHKWLVRARQIREEEARKSKKDAKTASKQKEFKQQRDEPRGDNAKAKKFKVYH